MSKKNNNNRPITIGDIKKFRKGMAQGALPILKYCGILLIVLGIISFFIHPENGEDTTPGVILFLLFGIVSIIVFYWCKKTIKKIKV